MTNFNEKTHAFLIGLFYSNLKAQHGERGISCFVKATQKMAEQRGARMALRALRDGHKLDYNSYMAYGEWTPTIPSQSAEVNAFPDCVKDIHSCAWHTTFEEIGLLECGLVYCKEIDRGIVRGFNPNLQFEVTSVLHDSPVCHMIFKDAYLDGSVKAPDGAKLPWEYHCAHVYKTYLETIAMIFGDAQRIKADVDAQFNEKFGADSAKELISDTDFNTI